MTAEAEHADVVVIGSGLAALVAARDCARIGARVLIVAHPPEGAIGDGPDTGAGPEPAHDIAHDTGHDAGLDADIDTALDAPTDGFDPSLGDIAALITELGLEDQLTPALPVATALHVRGRTLPLPHASYLGIPSSPLATDVADVIGFRASLRAYLDRLRPVLTIGRTRNFGDLVRTRMGSAVLNELVTPVVVGRFGSPPERLDIDIIDPRINTAMTRHGSLSGAAAERLAALGTEGGTRGGSAKDGTAGPAAGTAAGLGESGIRGGMPRLLQSLRSTLGFLDVRVDANAPVGSITVDESKPVRVRLEGGDAIETRGVIIATDQDEAIRLLSSTQNRSDGPTSGSADGGDTDGLNGSNPGSAAFGAGRDASALDLTWQPGETTHVVTLVVDWPEREAAGAPNVPTSPGDVFVAHTEAPGGSPVSQAGPSDASPALPSDYVLRRCTVLSAKWAWVANAVRGSEHGSRQVIRLVYGRDAGGAEASVSLGAPHRVQQRDADWVERALADAHVLIGAPGERAAVVAARSVTCRRPPDRATLGRADQLARLGEWLGQMPAIEVVGDWLSGAELGEQVADAREAAGRIRGGLVRGGFRIRQ